MTEDACMLHVAHFEFMDFRKKPLKSSFKKQKTTEEQRKRKQRIENRP